VKIFCCPHHNETLDTAETQLRELLSIKYVALFLEGDGERRLGERILFHTAKRYHEDCKCGIPQGDVLDRVISALENGWKRVDIENFDVLFAMAHRAEVLKGEK
jgi:hypothetical protein